VSSKPELSKTMRIDIHPDFLGQSLARKKSKLGKSGPPRPPSTKRPSVKSLSDYERLMECIYDGVLITGAEGDIVDFNERAVDFFFCDRNELRGTRVIELISGADESLLSAIRGNLAEHRHTLIEAHCIRRDSSMFPAEIAVNEIELGNGGRLCFLVRDVSVRKGAQEALEDAVARLEAHDRARTQFVSNVSHELRTPLTSMIYAISNMLRGVLGPIPERVRGYLEMLYGDSKRLAMTVNDILDLSKVDNKTLSLARTKIPFAMFVDRSVEALRVQAEQKGISLGLATGGIWFVDCDPQKMERVILNVVGNAVKFTPKGGIVDVSVGDDPGSSGRVRLEVRDTGVGIPPEAVAKVTERYFTVGEQPSGSGLGLAISKEIVECHGGTLEIVSPAPGAETGTQVSIVLPRVSPPRILLVDDDERVLTVLTEQVSRQGYATLTAMDGAEALRLVEEERPDLVVLDLMLPEVEGTEVILKMKSNEALTKTPIIVVTGAHVGEAKSHLLHSFAIPALAKPWREAELIDWIAGAFLGKGTIG